MIFLSKKKKLIFERQKRKNTSGEWRLASQLLFPVVGSGEQIEPLAGGLLERTWRRIEAEQEQIPFTMQGHPQRLRASVSFSLKSVDFVKILRSVQIFVALAQKPKKNSSFSPKACFKITPHRPTKCPKLF